MFLARIDPKSQECVYFHWLISAHCGAEFPTVQSHQNLRGSFGGAGLECSQVFQISGAVEDAGEYYVGRTQSLGQVDAERLWFGEVSGVRVRSIGILHHCGSERCFDVSRIVDAFQLAIAIEDAAGT